MTSGKRMTWLGMLNFIVVQVRREARTLVRHGARYPARGICSRSRGRALQRDGEGVWGRQAWTATIVAILRRAADARDLDDDARAMVDDMLSKDGAR